MPEHPLNHLGIRARVDRQRRRRVAQVVSRHARERLVGLLAAFHRAGTTSTGGLQVAANATVTVPSTGASSEALYGITASSTANVAFLYPG